MSEKPRAPEKPAFEGDRVADRQATAEAGVWVTMVAAIIVVAALENLTALPWYATYPLALLSGLVITIAYINLKSLARK